MVAEPAKYDKAMQQKRYEEEARLIMNSVPIGKARRPKKNVPALDCTFVSESFSDNFAVAKGSQVTKTWTFMNTGAQFIPKGSALCDVSGGEIQTQSIELEKDVGAGDYFEVSVRFTAPQQERHCIIQF